MTYTSMHWHTYIHGNENVTSPGRMIRYTMKIYGVFPDIASKIISLYDCVITRVYFFCLHTYEQMYYTEAHFYRELDKAFPQMLQWIASHDDQVSGLGSALHSLVEEGDRQKKAYNNLVLVRDRYSIFFCKQCMTSFSKVCNRSRILLNILICWVYHLQIFCDLLAGPRGKRNPTTRIFLGPWHYLVGKSRSDCITTSTRDIFYWPQISTKKVEQRAKQIESYAIQWRLKMNFSVTALLDDDTLKCSEFWFQGAATGNFYIFMHRIHVVSICCWWFITFNYYFLGHFRFTSRSNKSKINQMFLFHRPVFYSHAHVYD